jgi:hypothetical protein
MPPIDASASTSESIEAREVSGAKTAWTLTLSADALRLQRSDAPESDTLIVPRGEFFRALEYLEHWRAIVIPRPKRTVLRLAEPGHSRVRAWLGPRSRAELEHVVSVHFRHAWWTYALFVVVALHWSDAVIVAFAVLGFANSLAARFKPGAWQLLVNASLNLAFAARSAWQLWHGQVHSHTVGFIATAGCLLAAIPHLAAYWRFKGPLQAHTGARAPTV